MEGMGYYRNYDKKGKKQSRPGVFNDPRVEVTADLPTAAPDHTDMRSDRTYPGVPAGANSGKLFTRTSSKYGVAGV
jgi:hypothetical protein